MNRIKKSVLLYIILILSLFLAGCDMDMTALEEDYEDKLIVHFIDVGQGDSTLIEFPNGETSLIDGGTRKSSEKVVKYLKGQNIKKIDYLIATHPHEDHIGGLPAVIRDFDIGKVYMPDKTANTRIFEELLGEIQAKGLKINLTKAGDIILDKGNLKYTVLGPKGDYENTNNYSIVTKVEYKNNTFIITGDAEKESEAEMLEGNYNLKANVLRVGHHGSSTSSIDEFINAVNPEYFVISLGRDNSYGHPHKEVISKLEKAKGEILRTDELGDIVLVSNGEEVKQISKSNENGNEGYYIGNKNTKVVHTKDCGNLPNKENQVVFNSLEEAVKSGYKPHEKCIK